MEHFKITELTFQYPGRTRPALSQVDLAVQEGEFVVIFGRSGCGKTTLLRHLKPELIPHGLRKGAVTFRGQDLSEEDTAGKIGFVLQDPENGIVCDKVWHELVFGLESLGVDQAQMRTRAAEMAAFFGMEDWFYQDVRTLSGGQKQILCLASALILQPEALILDEPTSRLDPIAAGEFLDALRKVNRELGTTIILTEHRLEDVMPLADRAVAMEEGRIIAQGSPRQVEEQLRQQKSSLHQALPLPMRLYGAWLEAGHREDAERPCPVTVKEGRDWLRKAVGEPDLSAETTAETTTMTETAEIIDAALEWKQVWFRYEQKGEEVLKGLDYRLPSGQVASVLGGNGSGKTTALLLAAGVNRPQRGKVLRKGRAALVPQEPATLFTRKTARAELEEMLRKEGLSSGSLAERIRQTAREWELEEVLELHPYDLSGGEQQRLALAKVMLTQPEVLLLDEPTKGLDPLAKKHLADRLRRLKEAGVAIGLVSHDIDFCAQVSDRCGMLFDGRILSEGTPRSFFRDKSFYATAAGRLARGILPGILTEEDLFSALDLTEPCWDEDPPEGPEPDDERGGSDPSEDPEADGASAPFSQEEIQALTDLPYEAEQRRALHRRTALAAGMILGAIPLTIFCGIHFLADRNYYLISLLIILETMLPFLLIFEQRRPQARELILLAVMCAIAVLGRSIFFMVPEFKPVVALVIIAGLAFGGESGFLVGAMTGFVSNFFFGQGPWTPWQMFAFGIIGFLAGILFRGSETFYRTRRGRTALCLFGGAAALCIYGPVMNVCAVVTSMAYQPSREAFRAVFVSGFPFDCIHAVTTVICLWLLAGPMLEKLRRIKRKYGLL